MAKGIGVCAVNVRQWPKASRFEHYLLRLVVKHIIESFTDNCQSLLEEGSNSFGKFKRTCVSIDMGVLLTTLSSPGWAIDVVEAIPHALEKLQSADPLPSLLAGTDGGVVSDGASPHFA
jgi:hypothetical protein